MTVQHSETEGRRERGRPASLTELFDLVFALLTLGAETPDQVEDVRRGRIPVAKGRILSTLARAEDGGRDGMRIKDLADESGFPASTVSETVEQLVGQGILSRTRLETDRRSVVVRITETGRRAMRNPRIQGVWTDAVAGLSPEDVDAFWRVTLAAAENLRRAGMK